MEPFIVLYLRCIFLFYLVEPSESAVCRSASGEWFEHVEMRDRCEPSWVVGILEIASTLVSCFFAKELGHFSSK